MVLAPRRSPAPSEEEEVLWICEAEKSLSRFQLELFLSFPLRAGLFVPARLGGVRSPDVLRTRDWQLPRPGHGLHDDVRLLDPGCQQFGLRSGEKRLDDSCVWPCG